MFESPPAGRYAGVKTVPPDDVGCDRYADAVDYPVAAQRMKQRLLTQNGRVEFGARQETCIELFIKRYRHSLGGCDVLHIQHRSINGMLP